MYKAVDLGLEGVRLAASATVHTAGKFLGDDNKKITEGGPNRILTGKSELSIYDEARPMLDASALAYTISELRKSAKLKLEAYQKREGGLSETSTSKKLFLDKDFDTLDNALKCRKECSDKLVSLGSSSPAEEVENFSKAAKGVEGLMKKWDLTEDDVHKISHELQLLVLPKAPAQVKRDFADNADRIALFLTMFGGADYTAEKLAGLIETSNSESLFYDTDDDFSTADIIGLGSELVWGILINKKMKQITVVFRGTVPTVARDFITDFSISLTDFEIPSVKDRNDGAGSIPENIRGKVHTGFYGYLFGETKEGEDGRTISKSEAIMGELVNLFKQDQYKDFKLYVTGHSLGAALSTLFSFKAALSPDIPNKPVTNISFASPFVGEQKFRQAFQVLESKRLVRHLRMCNDEDIVPLGPPASMGFVGTFYKHVGMQVKLYDKSLCNQDTYKVSYPKIGGGTVDALHRAVKANVVFGLPLSSGIRHHLCPSYDERLEAAKDELQKFSIDDLYYNESITGPLIGKL